MPASVVTFETTNSEGETKSYLSVEDAKGYLALAQFGVVEFQSWSGDCSRCSTSLTASSSTSIPGEGIEWREIVEAAVHIKGELETLKLVPLVKRRAARASMSWCRSCRSSAGNRAFRAISTIAKRIAATAPQTFTTTMGKGNRNRADLHRFPPQRTRRDRGCALSLARPHQLAGLDARQLGGTWSPSTLLKI